MNDLEHFARDAEAQIIAANKRADELQEALSAANQRAENADKSAAGAIAESDALRLENRRLRCQVYRLLALTEESAPTDTPAPAPDYEPGKAC